jgi:hypothetical protein
MLLKIILDRLSFGSVVNQMSILISCLEKDEVTAELFRTSWKLGDSWFKIWNHCFKRINL